MWGPLGDPLSPLAPVSYKVHWTRGPRQLPGSCPQSSASIQAVIICALVPQFRDLSFQSQTFPETVLFLPSSEFFRSSTRSFLVSIRRDPVWCVGRGIGRNTVRL